MQASKWCPAFSAPTLTDCLTYIACTPSQEVLPHKNEQVYKPRLHTPGQGQGIPSIIWAQSLEGGHYRNPIYSLRSDLVLKLQQIRSMLPVHVQGSTIACGHKSTQKMGEILQHRCMVKAKSIGSYTDLSWPSRSSFMA